MSEQSAGRSLRRLPRVFYALALLLALLLFSAHAVVLFDVAGRLLLESRDGLEVALGFHQSSELIVIGCFAVLFTAHVAEAAVWALFLKWWRLVSSFGEGFYFTAATVTTLGYGVATLASSRALARHCRRAQVWLLLGVPVRRDAGRVGAASDVTP